LFDEPKLIKRVCARCSVFKEQAFFLAAVLAATFIYYHIRPCLATPQPLEFFVPPFRSGFAFPGQREIIYHKLHVRVNTRKYLPKVVPKNIRKPSTGVHTKVDCRDVKGLIAVVRAAARFASIHYDKQNHSTRVEWLSSLPMKRVTRQIFRRGQAGVHAENHFIPIFDRRSHIAVDAGVAQIEQHFVQFLAKHVIQFSAFPVAK